MFNDSYKYIYKQVDNEKESDTFDISNICYERFGVETKKEKT